MMAIALKIKRSINNVHLAVGILWLFQISAIIGISLGYLEWFVSKTPLNIILTTVLLIIHLPINTIRKFSIGGVFFLSGMLFEWIGVHHDWLFGSYYYGDNLGLKIDGVPWLMGLNWMILIFITGGLVQDFFKKRTIKITTGAFLMVFLDYFIEVSASEFDFWYFDNHTAPIQNYIAWFLIAAVLHTILQISNVRVNRYFAIQAFLVQLVFFLYFFIYHQ